MCLKRRKGAKAKPKLLTVDSRSFKGTAQTLARVKYVLAYLQTSNKSQSARAAKLSYHAHERIIKGLAKNGHLGESERPGRPALYTQEEMEAAYEVLASQQYGKLTGVALMRQLKACGKLHATAEPKRFLEHLSKFILKKGQRLITNCTKTTFFISVQGALERLKYARWWQSELVHRSLRSVVFCDEVVLEESPHPKGKEIPIGERGGRMCVYPL